MEKLKSDIEQWFEITSSVLLPDSTVAASRFATGSQSQVRISHHKWIQVTGKGKPSWKAKLTLWQGVTVWPAGMGYTHCGVTKDLLSLTYGAPATSRVQWNMERLLQQRARLSSRSLVHQQESCLEGNKEGSRSDNNTRNKYAKQNFAEQGKTHHSTCEINWVSDKSQIIRWNKGPWNSGSRANAKELEISMSGCLAT